MTNGTIKKHKGLRNLKFLAIALVCMSLLFTGCSKELAVDILDKALHLFLLGSSCNPPLQVRLGGHSEGVSGGGSNGKQAALLGLFCTGASIRMSSPMAVLLHGLYTRFHVYVAVNKTKLLSV